jgi:Fe-S-cluster containining protein
MGKDVHPADDQQRCRRCGTCCRKGGPGLHLEDRELVDSGKIPLSHLLTFRQGEPVYDNVSGRIAPAVTDIIRIKSLHDGRTECVYYDPAKKGCHIYHHRPSECDALQCWDTRKIEAVYNCRRLTRRHLLCDVAGLWDLVTHHQERCDYAHIAELADRIRQRHQAEAAEKELLELVRFDGHLRDLTLARGNLEPGMLEFLFGRPLSFTIKLFQLKINRTGSGFGIEPTSGKGAQVCYRRNPAVHRQ